MAYGEDKTGKVWKITGPVAADTQIHAGPIWIKKIVWQEPTTDGDDLVLKELTLENESYVDNILERKKKKSKTKKLSKRTRETLKKKADKANMPLGALTSVYRKGLAAWLTGHRQGVAQHQWAMARVNSFIRGGKTRSVDKSEWKRVQNFRKRKK